MRFRVFLILLGALLVAATYAFPLWQPLIATEADAPQALFPGLPDAQQTAFASLPADQQTAFRALAGENPTLALAMVQAALRPPQVAPEDEQELPALNGPVVAATGEFERIDPIRFAQGEITIYQQADQSKLLRFENFSAAQGADVRVVLSAHPQPRTPEEVQFNGLDLDLGALKGTSGNQHYAIAPETDLSQYNSVVLFSPSLNVVYSSASLLKRNL